VIQMVIQAGLCLLRFTRSNTISSSRQRQDGSKTRHLLVLAFDRPQGTIGHVWLKKGDHICVKKKGRSVA